MSDIRDHEATLLVTADQKLARGVARELRARGETVEVLPNGLKALARQAELAPKVAILDYDAPGCGPDLLRRLRRREALAGVVVLATNWQVEEVVAAVRLRADAFVSKPATQAEVLDAWQAACEAFERRRALEADAPENLAGMVGSSPAMRSLFRSIRRVAPSTASVLVVGESGTGKELVARAIHSLSKRASGPFVTLNCAALNEGVLESELFGHEKGAFTGAVAKRIGRFEQAHRGTLFLDEVADIPLPTQVKLLRVLQEQTFERVGGNETIQVDVRIVAATNRDLPELVRAGLFREDLYYRLNVVSLFVPPLRERIQDLPALVSHFISKYAKRNARPITGISEDALAVLMSYSWPGNIRELENAVERAVVMSEGPELTPQDFDLNGICGPQSDMPPIPGATLAEIERYAILKTLESTGGSTARTARILGVSVRKIQYKLKEYQESAKGRSRA